MSVQRADTELVLKLAELARHAPRAWSEALAEFRKYSDRVKDACIQSTPDMLQVNQGRAREAASLVQMFEQCVQNADTIAASRQKR